MVTNPRRISILALTAVASALSSTAWAQGSPFDHLKCYSIRDGLTPGLSTATLIPEADPPFVTQEGCRVRRPAKLFCIDVQKTNVQPLPPGANPGQTAGQFLCYRLSCPRLGADLPVEDQFGARSIRVNAPQWLCAPANRPPVPTQEEEFNFTGGPQTWVVPPGVTSIQVDARGAQGNAGPASGSGGLGGQVEATLSVTPGQTLTIYVGGAGGLPAGGFNGGGNGGNGTAGGNGGGGGGASDIRIGGSTLADRVLVAAGGGGAGADPRAGGAGGGLVGGFEVPAGGNGGGGGTQSTGGAAGSGLSCQGNAGTLGTGGAGGTGCNGATGGGGGGYYGGGGAGSSEAGGGGSSLVPSGGTTTPGVQAGHGQVTIRY